MVSNHNSLKNKCQPDIVLNNKNASFLDKKPSHIYSKPQFVNP